LAARASQLPRASTVSPRAAHKRLYLTFAQRLIRTARLPVSSAGRRGDFVLNRMISAYRREIRGEGIDDELPKGIAADLVAIWLVATLILVPVSLIWF